MNYKNWFKKSRLLEILIFSVLVICIIMIITYIIKFHSGLSDDLGDWGSFGEYFGTTAGLLAFLGVLYSVREAKNETKEAKNETAKREERDVFFKLLELYKDKLNSIFYNEKIDDIQSPKNNIYGIEAIELYLTFLNNILVDYTFYDCIIKMDFEELDKKIGFMKTLMDTEINLKFNDIKSKIAKSNNQIEQEITNLRVKEFIEKNIQECFLYKKFRRDKERPLRWSNLYRVLKLEPTSFDMYKGIKLAGNIINKEYGNILGQYIRNTFYVLETISQFNNNNRNYYYKLFRAQLSRSEALLLLFFAISDKSSLRFISLLVDNDILDEIYYKDLFFAQNGVYWGEDGNGNLIAMDMLTCYLNENEK